MLLLLLKELIFDMPEEFVIWFFWLLFRLSNGSGGANMPVLELSKIFFSSTLNIFLHLWTFWGDKNTYGFR